MAANRSALGRKIAQARMARGLSQRELSGMLGESESLVASWEGTSRTPGWENRRRLIRVLEMDLEDLLEDVPELSQTEWELLRLRKGLAPTMRDRFDLLLKGLGRLATERRAS